MSCMPSTGAKNHRRVNTIWMDHSRRTDSFTYEYIARMSFICEWVCHSHMNDIRTIYIVRMSFICEWVVRMSFICEGVVRMSFICEWVVRMSFICEWVVRMSFICEWVVMMNHLHSYKWIIHVGQTHSHMNDIRTSHGTQDLNGCQSVDMTHSCVWDMTHDSFICVLLDLWLIHRCVTRHTWFIWMSHESCHTHVDESWVMPHTHGWVVSHVTHTWMSRESCHTHMNESWVMPHTYEWLMSHATHKWMSHESCHTNMNEWWVMPHTHE